jgi:Tol biopolymer transport system component
VRDGRLEVLDFATLERRILPGTNGAIAPFWSPDESWIAYGAGAELRKIRLSGGESSLIAPLGRDDRFGSAAAGTWGTDDQIVFATGNRGLLSVPDQGGDPVEIAKVPEGELDYHDCARLPETKGWIVVVHGADGYGTLAVIDSKGKRHDLITLDGQSIADPVFSRSGHILYRRSGSVEGIWALPFSLAKLERTGEPFVVASLGQFPTVSPDGTLAYMSRGGSQSMTLAFVDRSGQVLQKIGAPAEYIPSPWLSSDGKQILTPILEGEDGNLWIVDVDRGTRKRMTSSKRYSFGFWEPNGQRIWYSTGVAFTGTIFTQSTSGIDEPKQITSGTAPMLTADGSRLFFTRAHEGQQDSDLWTMDLTREGAEPQKFLATDALEMWTVPSPTSSLLAYVSNSSGEFQVYLTTFPEVTNTWLVSTNRGTFPRWRGDGRELYYCAGDSILAVDVDPGGGTNPRLGPPRLLFVRPKPPASFGSFPNGFEVAHDGQRFLVFLPEEKKDETPPQVIVAQNWFEEFRK